MILLFISVYLKTFFKTLIFNNFFKLLIKEYNIYLLYLL